jgi:hypothetical protein
MNDPPLLLRFLVPAIAVVLIGCGAPDDRAQRSPTEESAESVVGVEPDTVPSPDPPAVSRTVYVPDYAHIYHGSRRTRYALTTTLSVRNTDPDRSITVRSVRYYNTNGELDRRFVERPRRLGPLGTIDFVVAEHDTSGGSGANFIVEWTAERPVSEPVIESVMISTRAGQGISFTSSGVPVVRRPEQTLREDRRSRD